MSPEEKRDLQYRARRAIAAPIPEIVRSGSVSVAANYKHCAAVVSCYLRNRQQAERARQHVMRLEALQGLA